MITAEELIGAIETGEEKDIYKIGVVTGLFPIGTAQITFDGEEEPSEKEYAYLESYSPNIGDKVLITKVSKTYIILGKINYNEVSDKEENIDRYLFDEKIVTMTNGLTVSGDSTFNNSLTAASLLVIGTATFKKSFTVPSLSTTGTVSGGAGSFGTLTANQNSKISAALEVTGSLNCGVLKSSNFSHTGSSLGFFGKTAATKSSVSYLSGTANESNNHNKINEIIASLTRYGLI